MYFKVHNHSRKLRTVLYIALAVEKGPDIDPDANGGHYVAEFYGPDRQDNAAIVADLLNEYVTIAESGGRGALSVNQ